MCGYVLMSELFSHFMEVMRTTARKETLLLSKDGWISQWISLWKFLKINKNWIKQEKIV